MVTGTVVNAIYERGEYTLTQGHKDSTRSGYKNGRYISQRGYGWASECRPSRITLIVNVEGHHHDVWVDRFFKDNWGRLTQNRQNAILNTIPSMVDLEENLGSCDTMYYTVCDSYMYDWLARAKHY